MSQSAIPTADRPVPEAAASAPPGGRLTTTILGAVLGLLLVSITTFVPALQQGGWQPAGPLLGIALVVFSLFGDLPAWISWLRTLGAWLFPGIAVGIIILLLPRLRLPSDGTSSFFAFSPLVWAAYLSIVAVGLAFEHSTWPQRIYDFCRAQSLPAATLVPLYVFVAGLAGNIFDGVSIIAVSVVIFLQLLERGPAIRASFALLFGGLISNLITVAAEPTNIKFQDVLGTVLDGVKPSYWFTNWPISVLGIILPALWLALTFRRDHITWKATAAVTDPEQAASPRRESRLSTLLSALALVALAVGIIWHSLLQGIREYTHVSGEAVPLWIFLLPAGVIALLFLLSIRDLQAGRTYVEREWAVWGKLMIIFSLIWFLSNGISAGPNVFMGFFTWPASLRYGMQVILSLLSSITDNVALAGMQGAIIINHPLPTWEIRLLFILLTWSGGFTAFGCLQSLALNSRLRLNTVQWFRASAVWALLSIIGGLIGLGAIQLIYSSQR